MDELWTEEHLKSALVNLIEASKNSVRGPERGGSEQAASGIFKQIVAAWNARAPSVPPGYALVPVVPDHALEDVFCEAWEDEKESLIATEGSYALAELFKAAWSAMLAAAAPKVQTVPEGWQDIASAPTTGFFLGWSPDFPDVVACWKAEIFHSAIRPGTPKHLSANHYTHWRYIDTPLAAAPKVTP